MIDAKRHPLLNLAYYRDTNLRSSRVGALAWRRIEGRAEKISAVPAGRAVSQPQVGCHAGTSAARHRAGSPFRTMISKTPACGSGMRATV